MKYFMTILTSAVLLWASLAILACCDSTPQSTAKAAEPPSPFKMNCVQTSQEHVNIYRCENEEAICYSGYSHDSVSCHWKPVK